MKNLIYFFISFLAFTQISLEDKFALVEILLKIGLLE